MKILVKGRNTLGELASERHPVAIISISDDPKDFQDIPGGCTCLAVLRQHFHDVEVHFAADMFEPEKTVIKAFTEEQATEVAKFVSSLPGEVETLVFQCEVGISRSAGMAAAVARHLGHDDMRFFLDHLPNRRVYRMTLEALRELDHWRCTNCGCVEWREREVRCWSCGEGEMVYRGPDRSGLPAGAVV